MTTDVILAEESGSSDSLHLREGIWNLFLIASSWGSATLQVSPDNINWINATDCSGDVVFTASKSVQINGSLYIRLNVTTYTANITLVALRVQAW